MRQPVRRGHGLRLKHLNASGYWPSGNTRYYYRPKGQKGIAMPDLPPDHPRFLAAYSAAAGTDAAPMPTAPRTGSIGAACVAFLASDEYLSRAPSTRAVWRRMIDDIRTRYGSGRLADLRTNHIRADLARLGPHPANNRLKVWRAMSKWWLEVGLVKTNEAAAIAKRTTARTDGHEPWTATDITSFRDHWPIGTAERLAFELLQWTGARMSDAVRLSETMIDREGWITFRQKKTGGEVSIPLFASPPDFADPAERDHLIAALEAREARHLVLMVTQHGKPRSIKGASSWFARSARAAGVEKSAHGLRKYRAELMAERGATAHQIGAWTGHESLSEVQRYASKANRRRILSGTTDERKSSNSRKKLEL